MNDPTRADSREPRGSGAVRRQVEPRQDPRVYPDRLVRVLAEGLRSIEERRAREQTEFRNRAIIVPPKTEEPSDEPAPEP